MSFLSSGDRKFRGLSAGQVVHQIDIVEQSTAPVTCINCIVLEN